MVTRTQYFIGQSLFPSSPISLAKKTAFDFRRHSLDHAPPVVNAASVCTKSRHFTTMPGLSQAAGANLRHRLIPLTNAVVV